MVCRVTIQLVTTLLGYGARYYSPADSIGRAGIGAIGARHSASRSQCSIGEGSRQAHCDV